jgi:hypothetical protein
MSFPRSFAATAIATAACGVLLGGTAARAEEALSTDRPDFVESSDVVGRGRLQLETSFAAERDKVDGVRITRRSLPTLLRIGMADDWELRFETEGPTRVSGAGERVSGMSDISVGIKWHAQDGSEEAGRPGTAWLVDAELPTGSRALRGDGVRPAVRYVAEWELPHDAAVGVMAGAAIDREDGRRQPYGILAVTTSRPLAPDWRGFVELAGQRLASTRNGGNVVTFDFGLVWRITPDLQLDTAFAVGANRNAPDLGWTLGVSARF